MGTGRPFALELSAHPHQILSLSTERLYALIERAPIAMVLLDPSDDHGLRIVSDGLAALLGYTPQELSSQRLRELLHPDDRGAGRLVEELRTGRSDHFQIEARYRHRDGHYVWLLVTGAMIRGLEDESLYVLGHLADITPTKRSQEELRRAADLQQTLTGNLPETTVALIDRDLNVLAVEGAGERMRAHRAALGRRLDHMTHLLPQQLENILHHVRLALTGEHQEYEAVYEDRAFHTAISPLFDEDSEPYAAVLVSRNVTSEHRAHQQLRMLARFDSLTGLPNRDAFRERLAAVLGAGASELDITLMFLDVDNFKAVNDYLGHDAGDELLSLMAERIRSSVREEDEVFRLSGDEFTVILAPGLGVEGAAGVAQRILDAIAMPVVVAGHELFSTASLGIAQSPGGSDDRELLKAADLAMYAAKRGGRNTYRFFRASMAAAAEERLRLTSALHRAVERDELELHYLPQVSLADERMVSVEALVRWRHPERGLLGPQDFIPLAEETGLIVPLGKWVIEAACRQLARWRTAGRSDLRVAVNVSAAQVQLQALPFQVKAALQASGLPASALELEITESALMDADRTEPVLDALKDLGVGLAIDDFGTGYSSLSRLRAFPIDVLKIDREFVADVPGSADAVALVRSIIALADSLGVSTLAEGVETTAQRDHLVKLGCAMAAGWLWSRPLPAEELTAQFERAAMLSRT